MESIYKIAMNQLLLVNATIVNEGQQLITNVLTEAVILYKCGWSPLQEYKIGAKIYGTVVNGIIAF